MFTIENAQLVLKDKDGNVARIQNLGPDDFAKIRNAIADIGKLVDPVSHLPIKATATTVGVVQLADDEAIAAGTTGRVVDAKQLQDAVMGVSPANCVTNVAAGSTANKIKVTKDGYTTTIEIDNVEHASFANQATHATQADTAASANSVSWDNVNGKPSSYTPSSHTHDDRYYTEPEIDAKLSGYLPLAGGNLTGNLTVQNSNVVRTVNGIGADVNGNVVIGSDTSKADKNLSNIDNTAKIAIAHNSMPSDVYYDLTLGAPKSQYVAPADGFFMMSEVQHSIKDFVLLTTGFMATCSGGDTYGNPAVILPVRKSQIVEVDYYGSTDKINLRFIYAVGSESERV